MESKEFIDLVQKHMVVWPTTEDSELWNKRVDALIEMVNEAERKKYESLGIRPPVNPTNAPMMCKHLMKFTKALQESGVLM